MSSTTPTSTRPTTTSPTASLPAATGIRTGVSAGPDQCPVSPLAAVGRALDALSHPQTVVFDGTGFAGLPQRPIGLRELRRRLLDRSMSPQARDAVWRDLVTRTRRPAPEGPAWTLACVGLALPGLTAAGGLLGGTADSSISLTM